MRLALTVSSRGRVGVHAGSVSAYGGGRRRSHSSELRVPQASEPWSNAVVEFTRSASSHGEGRLIDRYATRSEAADAVRRLGASSPDRYSIES